VSWSRGWIQPSLLVNQIQGITEHPFKKKQYYFIIKKSIRHSIWYKLILFFLEQGAKKWGPLADNHFYNSVLHCTEKKKNIIKTFRYSLSFQLYSEEVMLQRRDSL
jgi:hypothetical protein